jgi:hypothetical protein
MDFMNYVSLAEAKQYRNKTINYRKNEIRDNIIKFYQEKFLDRMGDYSSLESLDAHNRTVISAIVNFYKDELNTVYDCYYSKNAVLVVRGILMQAGIYKATAYTKTKDVFYMVKFARDYLPDPVFQVWRLIPTDKYRFKALFDYACSNNDQEIIEFLQISKEKCRIV